jgi:hypothetical protein
LGQEHLLLGEEDSPSARIMVKIAMWNVCLATKKDFITRSIVDNNIDIGCLQETEILVGFLLIDLTSSITTERLKIKTSNQGSA